MQRPPAIFLMGPTACGKTDAALFLADHLPCEIISVDSAQVYRGMDIGSAKPDLAIRQRVPHHLIDIRDPAETYSVAEFRRDALRTMADITARGRIPLLAGGTMLYFKALRDGLADLPETDLAVREAIQAEAQAVGWPAMHDKLASIDPVTAARLHPNHSQRIARALEVHAITGETLSALQANQVWEEFPYRLLQLALLPQDREALYRRIDQRLDLMIEGGLIKEVKTLYERGDLSMELPAMRSVGYRQVWEYLRQLDAVSSRQSGVSESLTREQMIVHAKMATRQLAKRQLTWLRSWPDLEVVPVLSADNSDSAVGASCLRAVNAFLYPGA